MRKKYIFLILSLYLFLIFNKSCSQELSIPDELNQSAEQLLTTHDIINKTPSVELEKNLDNLSISTDKSHTTSSASSQSATTSAPNTILEQPSATKSPKLPSEIANEQKPDDKDVNLSMQSVQINLEEEINKNASVVCLFL
jgi:hypothetical protein